VCARALNTPLAQPGCNACHCRVQTARVLRRGSLCSEAPHLPCRVEALVVLLVLAVKLVGPEHGAQLGFGFIVPPEHLSVHACQAQVVDRCELDPGDVQPELGGVHWEAVALAHRRGGEGLYFSGCKLGLCPCRSSEKARPTKLDGSENSALHHLNPTRHASRHRLLQRAPA